MGIRTRLKSVAPLILAAALLASCSQKPPPDGGGGGGGGGGGQPVVIEVTLLEVTAYDETTEQQVFMLDLPISSGPVQVTGERK